MPFVFPKSFIFLLTTSFLAISTAYSQSVWDNAKNAKGKAGQKISKEKSSARKWAEHIKQWGLSENYNRKFTAGAKLSSNGWSGNAYYERRLKPGKNELFEISFSEIKDEKQLKQQIENKSFPQFGTAIPYVFGKINNLYILQVGYGREQLLLPDVVNGNLSISFQYAAGFSLAMLKPYYLKLIYTDYSKPEPVYELKEEKYGDNSNQEQFLKQQNIFSRDKWSKGLDQTKFAPGIFGYLAFIIEPAPKKRFCRGYKPRCKWSFL